MIHAGTRRRDDGAIVSVRRPGAVGRPRPAPDLAEARAGRVPAGCVRPPAGRPVPHRHRRDGADAAGDAPLEACPRSSSSRSARPATPTAGWLERGLDRVRRPAARLGHAVPELARSAAGPGPDRGCVLWRCWCSGWPIAAGISATHPSVDPGGARRTVVAPTAGIEPAAARAGHHGRDGRVAGRRCADFIIDDNVHPSCPECARLEARPGDRDRRRTVSRYQPQLRAARRRHRARR